MTRRQIKQALKDRGVTYADVAEHADVTWQMVYMVLRGDRRSSKVIASMEALAGVKIGGVKRDREKRSA